MGRALGWGHFQGDSQVLPSLLGMSPTPMDFTACKAQGKIYHEPNQVLPSLLGMSPPWTLSIVKHKAKFIMNQTKANHRRFFMLTPL